MFTLAGRNEQTRHASVPVFRLVTVAVWAKGSVSEVFAGDFVNTHVRTVASNMSNDAKEGPRLISNPLPISVALQNH